MATSSSSGNPSKATHSCVRCADRKVKCDRENPCTACVKHNVACVFVAHQPARRGRRQIKEKNLENRLKHYESLLQSHGIDPNRQQATLRADLGDNPTHTANENPKETQILTPASIQTERSRSGHNPRVLYDQGTFQFVENSLYSRVVEELQDPDDTLEESSYGASDPDASEDDFGFVLDSQPRHNTKPRHPSSERIQRLWQIFVENVDPLTKLIHVPTVRPAIQKAASNPGAIPRSFEALMFSIYSAAVMSLKDEDCKERLGEPRKTLLSRYISATKTALSRAGFMKTTSLVVLQALILHLISVRDFYEPRAMWSLTGVAVRIAQSMGLERDGEVLGLPPFEIEMRRRIWWLLKTHDFRTAELCGLAKFRDLETGPDNTKWPTDLNDNQLFQGMPALLPESDTLTDNVFLSLRYQLANFATSQIAKFRRQGATGNQWDLHMAGSDKVELGGAVKELEELLETKYLRYCDPSQPLHLVTMLVARFALNIILFMRNHPRRWAGTEQTSLSERKFVWNICLKLLEQHSMLHSNPQLKQFAWHAAYHQQWHALIHVLDTLGADPLIEDAERAWQLVGSIYENTPEMIFDTRKPIYVAVGQLCLKVYGVREAVLHREDRCSTTPDYIVKLRQQRDTARAKRQARAARTSQVNSIAGDRQAVAMEARPDAASSISGDIAETMHPSTFMQTNTTTGADQFWLSNGFGDSQASSFDDMMDMDATFMLDQGVGAEDGMMHSIIWDQWDAWLADSNMIPQPLLSRNFTEAS